MNKDGLFDAITEYIDDNWPSVPSYSTFRDVIPERGQVVLVGQHVDKEYCFDNNIARVFQIKLVDGKAAIWVLRYADGSLITSKSQIFHKVPDLFINSVNKYFKTDVELELECGARDSVALNGNALEVGKFESQNVPTYKP